MEQQHQKLKHTLILQHTKKRLQCLADLSKKRPQIEAKLTLKDKRFVKKFIGLCGIIHRYKNEHALDTVLDTIDLGKLYSGVEQREAEAASKQDEKEAANGLQYEDFVVLELLQYFKHDFFKWVNKPECPNCKSDSDNIVSKGAAGPPQENPDGISVIEKYRCTKCNIDVDFPRINNPVSLLTTRRGRCGEWVNCFMLILQAVLGSDAKIRYVWNHEDHVWCEYYSKSLKRWVHLDPCEAAFDEPNLYCDNWGKRMSWVIGINDSYIIDLSDKYITNKDKVIDKATTVSNVALIGNFIKLVGFNLMLNYYNGLISSSPSNTDENLIRFYYDCILLYQSEFIKPSNTSPEVLKTSIKGRQTGGIEWTKARGEDGN